jgi:hypothetical protein
VACLVGAGVAVVGALYAFASLPGRSQPADHVVPDPAITVDA